jgi:catechol 2,3-dioxygenase-like lactoylglutathione lyase family enzyme
MQRLALNHLNLPARDPNALRRWYVEKLGFEERGRFLWSAGTLLVFTSADPLGRPEVHFGFRVDSLTELHEWVGALRDRGLDPGEIQGDEKYSTVFVHDPDGNKIELFYEPVPE